jgi:hypothetical protein
MENKKMGTDLSKYKKSFKLEDEKQLKPAIEKTAVVTKTIPEEKLIMINFRVPVSLQRKIKEALVSDEHYGATQNEFLVDAVKSYLVK